MIIEDTLKLLRSRYGNILETLTISDFTIGLHLTAVRLSDGSIGASATVSDNMPFCSKPNRDFGDFTPLKTREKKVIALLDSEKESSLILSLKMAVLNAISTSFITPDKYKIIENSDPIQLLDLHQKKTITVVGAFHSYIRKISETDNKLNVLEMNETALPNEFKRYFVPAAEYRSVLPLSEIVIITGQTLVNRTIDELLDSVSANAQVIVSGPSGSLIPDVLFENKVSIIGAVRITDPEKLFRIAGEGGTGYHLFEYCAKKICIVK